MDKSNIEYLQRRAGEERVLAAACSDPAVAQVHRHLAELYEDRASDAATSADDDFDDDDDTGEEADDAAPPAAHFSTNSR